MLPSCLPLSSIISSIASWLQATDKEAFLHRFVALERALKDALSRQGAIASDLDAKVAAHRSHMDAVLREMRSSAAEKEAVLRAQLDAALRRLRAYAREVEQHMEAVCPVGCTIDSCRHCHCWQHCQLPALHAMLAALCMSA